MTTLPVDPPGILPRVLHSFAAAPDHYTPGRANASGLPVGVLLHSTEGRDSRAWLSFSSGATQPDQRVSINTLGRQEGIYAIVAPLDTAWHAGWCKHPDGRIWRNANADLFGHEIEHIAGQPYTATDYNQAAWVCARAIFSFGFPITALYRHAQIAVWPPGHPQAGQFGRKTDPTPSVNGIAFDMMRLLRETRAWLTFFQVLPPEAHQYWIVDGAGETLGWGGLV
jgi:N-acetyl-anhydromuramyl-L-alanine amidase AmpD